MMITRDFLSRFGSSGKRACFSSKRLGFIISAGLTLLLQTIIVQPVLAASQLVVAPTRIVFEGRMRTAQVTLANTGDTTGRYRISFVRKQMNEAGNLVEIKDDTPGMYSDPMVRFSPREVTLPPGQPQVVRLMLRKKSGLEEGEYRSHMLFQALPDPAATSIESLAGQDSKNLQIQLIPVVGVSIPIIVRHGNLQASASLNNLKILPPEKAKGQSRLSLSIKREGNRSVYGDFKVTYHSPNGKSVVVSQANGVAIYTPNSQRNLVLNLQPPPGVILKGGELHVSYLKHGEETTAGLIAEAQLRVP